MLSYLSLLAYRVGSWVDSIPWADVGMWVVQQVSIVRLMWDRWYRWWYMPTKRSYVVGPCVDGLYEHIETLPQQLQKRVGWLLTSTPRSELPLVPYRFFTVMVDIYLEEGDLRRSIYTTSLQLQQKHVQYYVERSRLGMPWLRAYAAAWCPELYAVLNGSDAKKQAVVLHVHSAKFGEKKVQLHRGECLILTPESPNVLYV